MASRLIGFDNYLIFKNGKVKNISTNKILRPFPNKDGYPAVALYSAPKKFKTFMIHRLLAILFIKNTFNKPHINHKDGDKTNFKLNNLEWCTPTENIVHAYDRKLRGKIVKEKGEGCHLAKLTNNKVLEIREWYSGGRISQRGLMKEYNVSRGCIRAILQRRTWTHI